MNWVRSVSISWVNPSQWNYTERIVAGFNIEEGRADAGPITGEEGNDEGNNSSGSDEPPLLTNGEWGYDASVSRNGYVMATFTASLGLLSPASAGIAWSLDISYSDSFNISAEGGGSAGYVPNPDYTPDSPGEGQGGSSAPEDQPDYPSNFIADSTWSFTQSISYYSNGTLWISSVPSLDFDGGIIHEITLIMTYQIGGELDASAAWASASQSGSLSLPDHPLPEGATHPLAGCPVGSVDADTLGPVEGTGHASASGGSVNRWWVAPFIP